MKHKKEETKLSYLIAEYLELQYPDIIFRFDIASNLKMTIGQAKLIKDKFKHKRGFPDLTIFQPSTDGFHGLFLELKKDRNSLYKKNGQLRKNKHILEQLEVIKKMNSLGYYANFSCGFDETKMIIDIYLKGHMKHWIEE